MRVVVKSQPYSRTPWLIAGGALSALGMALIIWRLPLLGWVALLPGAGLLLVTARPGYSTRERIILDDSGVTDLATKLGPVPWTDIIRAEVRPLSNTSLVTLEVNNREHWESQAPQTLKRLRDLAPELNLPPVMLFTPRLEMTPEEIVRLINQRARGGEAGAPRP